MSRLYLLDANGLSHWLWHSKAHDDQGSELTLPQKVAGWWRDLYERFHPEMFVACFDGANNWRYEEYAEYKASRKAKPVDEAKLAALREMPALWRSFGVPVVTVERFEADDVIATLCARFSGECEIITVATDKDLLQLVEQFDGGPMQYDPRPNKAGECVFYDARAVEEKHGVPPHRIPDMLAMQGDTSDDVPGIDGIGKVQAVNAIRQTKTAAEIFRKAAKHELQAITTKNQDKIVAGRADFDLSLRLVTLRYDAPIDLTLDACRVSLSKVAA
jgi:DNA polymerase-1